MCITIVIIILLLYYFFQNFSKNIEVWIPNLSIISTILSVLKYNEECQSIVFQFSTIWYVGPIYDCKVLQGVIKELSYILLRIIWQTSLILELRMVFSIFQLQQLNRNRNKILFKKKLFVWL